MTSTPKFESLAWPMAVESVFGSIVIERALPNDCKQQPPQKTRHQRDEKHGQEMRGADRDSEPGRRHIRSAGLRAHDAARVPEAEYRARQGRQDEQADDIGAPD